MKVNSKEVKWKAEAPKFGQVVINLSASGRMTNNMEQAYSITLRTRPRGRANGAPASATAGSTHLSQRTSPAARMPCHQAASVASAARSSTASTHRPTDHPAPSKGQDKV